MNAGALIAWMRSRVPATAVPADFSWYTVLNRAGRDFHNAHPWGFAEETTSDIAGVAGSPWIKLPDDFVSLLSVQSTDQGRDSVMVVTADEINRQRSGVIAGSGSLWRLCFDSGRSPPTQAEHPSPWAMIEPTPSQNGSPALTITYERGWRDIPEGQAAVVPNIRPHCLTVFMDFCENAAWEALFDREPPHLVRKAARLAQLIAKDEAASPIIGPVRGGLPKEEDDDYTLANELTET